MAIKREPEREIHLHIHIGGPDTTQLVAAVQAANATLARIEEQMATFDEKLDAMLTKATELKEQVSREAQESRDVTANFQTAVDNLTAERDRLQAIIDSGQATPAQEAKLDEINAALDDAKAGIDQIVNPTSPPPVDPNAPPV